MFIQASTPVPVRFTIGALVKENNSPRYNERITYIKCNMLLSCLLDLYILEDKKFLITLKKNKHITYA